MTFSQMRAAAVTSVLVYCSDCHCSHWKRFAADRWLDEVRLSDIERAFFKK
jgi:hypothetical protein